MPNSTPFDKIQKHLFDDPETRQKHLTPKQIEQLERYREVFTMWLDKPYMRDSDIVKYMITHIGLSKSMAYYELPKLKLLLGNVRNASKEHARYMVLTMAQEAWQIARDENDGRAMAAAANVIGKYFNLDKEDIDKPDWNQVMPPSFEPSADVGILKLKKRSPDELEELQRKLRQKYMDETADDADYEEV